MWNPRITVIVLSYNRPRMIREALGSIIGADEVIIADDGSDFDLGELGKEFTFPSFSIVGMSKMPTSERIHSKRLGVLLNKALHQVSNELVTYLCDDDLMDKDWLPIAKQWFEDNPDEHLLKGIWGSFDDGGPILKTRAMFMDGRLMTTGNFVHLATCTTIEGAMWPEDRTTSHDDGFAASLHEVHGTISFPMLPNFAGYRREHDFNLRNYEVHKDKHNTGTVNDDFKKILTDKKWLE